MIDFENYERVTGKDEWGTVLKDVNMGDLCSNLSKIDQISVEYALDRLAELEDLIEQKRLLPAFFVTKTTYGFWTIGSYTKEYYCYGFDTKQEAEKKLKELMESDENE